MIAPLGNGVCRLLIEHALCFPYPQKEKGRCHMHGVPHYRTALCRHAYVNTAWNSGVTLSTAQRRESHRST